MDELFFGRRVSQRRAVLMVLVICIASIALPSVPTWASTPVEDVLSETPKVLTLHYGTNRDHEFHRPFRSHSEWTLEYFTLGTWAVTLFLIYRFRRRKHRVTAVLACVSLVAALFLSGTFVNALIDESRQVASDQYGTELGPLNVGVCDVSIPPHHLYGQVETTSIFKWEFVADRMKDVVIQETSSRDVKEFEQSLAKALGEASRRDIFLFVHGFNTSFADAADRAAQLAHDTRFQGVPAFYSWPSQAMLTKYKTDERLVAESVEPFRRYLRMLMVDAKPATIHILAHSMGNQLLTMALAGWDLKEELGPGEQLPEIRLILAAPDVDAGHFCDKIAPEIPIRADHVTLYTSPSDMALLASQMEHHGKPRLGMWQFDDYAAFLRASPYLSDDTEEPFPEVESIVYIAKDSIPEELGHGYYAHHPDVILDLSELINEYRSASQRTLPSEVPVTGSERVRVWQLR